MIARKVTAEFLGTGFLVAAVIGSGIMAERLSAGNASLALLENTVATGAALCALILAFGPISGGHFNPAVTVSDATQRGLPWKLVPGYILAQFAGGIAGTLVAHAMFAYQLIETSTRARNGLPQLLSEFVASFGLMSVIWGTSRTRRGMVPFAVAAYISAAYWFTASTSFANPAVTLARSFSDTFAGIRPSDTPAFIVAQFAGAIAATLLFRWLTPSLSAKEILMPHPEEAPRIFLFACTHNAGRSQMAAALFNRYADAACCRGVSAGTAPSERVDPQVVKVMSEVDIDLSTRKPQQLDEALAASADVLVTMGCGERCPYVPGLRIIDWELPDPKGQPEPFVRALRDEIAHRVKNLIAAECR